jgi:peptidoglycan/xylan/chitin deacetylase (PgdA/CDA1 family)
VPGEVFAAQIEELRADGWQPIAHGDLIRGLGMPDGLPPKAFLVTFDDAYLSLRDEAVTWLERLDLPAVVFAPTDFIGGWNRFDHDVEPREEICDWDNLRELERRGVSIQSHGVSHRAFSSIPFTEQERETTTSKRIIEEQLGSRVELFAYPYGDPGDAQRVPEALERAGYEAGFCYGGGAFRLPVTTPYLLPRLAMGPDTDVREELRG